MAGFRKAKAEQAALKLGLYGPAGSGKTFTALLIAEGIAASTGRRIAYVDTERGTDFYTKAVPARGVHPDAFDFDAIYTRSIAEVLAAVKSVVDADEYGVVVLDSVTHLWESCIAAYKGRTTGAGTIPFHAWGKIKKPYKDLMAVLLSTPLHVIICGRQKNEYGEDEDGELKMLGVTMRAEGETPYEPHILIRMQRERSKTGQAPVSAFVEKDRTGLLAGKTIILPPDQPNGFTFDAIGRPLLALLGGTQARIPTADETAQQDAEAFEDADEAKAAKSAELLRKLKAQVDLAETDPALQVVMKTITPAVKAEMTNADVNTLRQHCRDAMERVKRAPAAESGESKPAPTGGLDPENERVVVLVNLVRGHVGEEPAFQNVLGAIDAFLREKRKKTAVLTGTDDEFAIARSMVAKCEDWPARVAAGGGE